MHSGLLHAPAHSFDLDDMSPDDLNLQVARSCGIEIAQESPLQVRIAGALVDFSPATELEQASFLITRYGISLRCLSKSRPGGLDLWGAWMGTELVAEDEMAQAANPAEAVVLAFLASVLIR